MIMKNLFPIILWVVCSTGQQGGATGAQRGTSEHRRRHRAFMPSGRTERSRSTAGSRSLPCLPQHDTRQRASAASIIVWGRAVRRLHRMHAPPNSLPAERVRRRSPCSRSGALPVSRLRRAGSAVKWSRSLRSEQVFYLVGRVLCSCANSFEVSLRLSDDEPASSLDHKPGNIRIAGQQFSRRLVMRLRVLCNRARL